MEKKFDRIDKAIDDICYYSYQYNLKIVGVPQINENESAEDTANLCLKLFSSFGNDISASDIDIAHRVRLRNATTDNGHRRQLNAIICKFTRRMSREKLLASRRNTTQLTTEVNRIKIYSHLTPRLQELLHAAKAQQTHTITSGAGLKGMQSSFAKQIHQQQSVWSHLTIYPN